MNPDATNPETGHGDALVLRPGAPTAPVHPVHRPTVHRANGTTTDAACTGDVPASARITGAPVHAEHDTAPDTGAPVQPERSAPVHRSWGAVLHRARAVVHRPDQVHAEHDTGAPEATPAPRTGATPTHGAGAPVQPERSVPVRRRWGAVFRMHRPDPGHDTKTPVHPSQDGPGHTATAPVRSTPARTRPARKVVAAPTLGEQWGKLTGERSRGTVIGLRILGFLIVVSLIGVVVAPPALSAHDIIAWAGSNSPESGLGLSRMWSWVTFLALDFAAGVCVLICVYCAIVNTKPGVFALYVWAFAGATAYANYSFGTRPGAPGDAFWFFPTMSVVGPLLLHSVLVFLRKRIKGAQGNKRGQRPTFPLADWLPITGTPQDTYGAWRTGAMLGIEVPDAALWAYRAVSLDANWFSRWCVKRLVRAEQTRVFRARLNDEGLALAIPGLVPDGAFTALVHADDVAPAGADSPDARTGAPVHGPAVSRSARTGAPSAPGATGAIELAGALAGAPAAPTSAGPEDADAPVQGAAPVDPVRPGVDASGASVVNLDTAARNSALAALTAIFKAYGASSDYGSWDELISRVSRNRIERELNIGKRRSLNAFNHAEAVLPWATAREQAGRAEAM